MQPILFIAPNRQIAMSAKLAQKKYNFKMDVQIGLMQEGVEIAKKRAQQEPPKVLLSRGGTALLLKSQMSIPVVEIKIALPDAARALEQAGRYGRKVMFLGFANHIQGVQSLNSLIECEIHEVVLTDDWRSTEEILRKAKRDGFDAIIGGALQQQAAERVGIPFIFLEAGPVAIYNGYMQAKELLDAILIEERKMQEIRTILDDTRDGFVAIDLAGSVTLINKSAAAMIGRPREQVLQRPIAESIPALAKLTQALSGAHGRDDIVAIGNNSLLFQQTSLVHQQNVVGAMATLKSISSVKKDESYIRYNQYKSGLYAKYRFQDIVGNSATLIAAKELAERYAKVDSTVLIVSESGTGKEMFAQSIHNASLRGEGPFVAINCAALSSNILESELFGYVDGAFTGAKKGGKVGVFEMANNGTIFLDEIGELPPDIQGKLLRVLQERCVMSLGDTKIVPVDVRVIVATNRNLVKDVQNRHFRQDLFFRLDVLRLSIPPLRERPEDIPALCQLFLRKYAGSHPPKLAPDTLRKLAAYAWPGNIRELENLMERVSIGDAVEAHGAVLDHITAMAPLTEAGPQPMSADAVRAALQRTKGNKKRAAELLGVHRSTLYRYLEQTGL